MLSPLACRFDFRLLRKLLVVCLRNRIMSRFVADRAYDYFDLGDESDQDRAERYIYCIDI